MLKDRVTGLLDLYENGDELLTADDVCEELEGILQEEPWDDELSRLLYNAIDKFDIARTEYARYCGHVEYGGDEFIETIEQLINYDL